MEKYSLQNKLENIYPEIWKLEEDELFIELGRILQLNRSEYDENNEISLIDPVAPSLDDAELQGPIDFLAEFGKNFFISLNHQFYSLVCNPKDPDNDKVVSAISKGAEKFGLILAGLLIAKFGLLPAIAGVIAAIIAKRFTKSAHEAVCKSWKSQLE